MHKITAATQNLVVTIIIVIVLAKKVPNAEACKQQFKARRQDR